MHFLAFPAVILSTVMTGCSSSIDLYTLSRSIFFMFLQINDSDGDIYSLSGAMVLSLNIIPFSVHLHVHTRSCVCACVHVCMHACVCIHTHVWVVCKECTMLIKLYYF